jgi:hypothetical protein
VVELVRLVYPHHSGRGGVDRFTLWVRHVHGVAAYTYVRVGITCPAGRCQRHRAAGGRPASQQRLARLDYTVYGVAIEPYSCIEIYTCVET